MPKQFLGCKCTREIIVLGKVSNHFAANTDKRDYCNLSLGHCTQAGFSSVADLTAWM